jgi:hypothetical protein
MSFYDLYKRSLNNKNLKHDELEIKLKELEIK